jgi:hypothetical protein
MRNLASKPLYTDAAWHIGTHVGCRPIIIIGLLLVVAFSKSHEAHAEGVTQTGNVLRGIIKMNEAVSAGTIIIYNGSEQVQVQPNLEFGNGTLEIQLNARASELLESGDLRVEVLVNQPGQAPAASDILMADLHDFDAGSQVVFINPATTIISAYRELQPAASYTQAEATVDATLGLSPTSIDACQPTTGPPDFNSQAFVTDSRQSGGLNAAVWGMAQAAVSGASNASYSLEFASASLAQATSANGEALFREAVLRLGKGIAKRALKAIPLGEVVVGFVLDQVLKAPKEDTEQKNEAAKHLKEISAQLDNLLSGIQGISAQLASVEGKLSAQANLLAYQAMAAKIQTNINHLCNLNADLLFLAAAPVDEDNTDFAKTLIANIQTTSANDLSDIWSGLEGNPSLNIPGLIGQWRNVLNPPGAPQFLDNSYLTPAQTNFLYYVGPQMIGTNLRVQLGHALANTLGDSITRAALTNFDNHYNAQMKLVGLNIAIPPATRYAAEPLPSDGWIIDDRSGLLWLSSNPCPPTGKCLFNAYRVPSS